MRNQERIVVIPAAGRGSRLGGETPKPFVPIAPEGPSLIEFVMNAFKGLVDRYLVVTSPDNLWRLEPLCDRYAITGFCQETPSGMLDAIAEAKDDIPENSCLSIAWSDQIGLSRETISHCLERATSRLEPTLFIPLAFTENPYVEFCLVDGAISDIRQSRVGDSVSKVGLTDVGFFAVNRAREFFNALSSYQVWFREHSPNSEADFMPFVTTLTMGSTVNVEVLPSLNPRDLISVNTPADLDRARKLLVGFSV